MLISPLLATDPWKGNEYAQNSESQRASAVAFLSKLSLEGNEKILDVGCGDGKITAEVARALPRGYAVGVDISPSMIQTAKSAFAGRENVHFVIRDATQLNYVNQFDIITSFRVMFWVLEQEKALRSMHTALKEGGKVCIQMPTGLPEPLMEAIKLATNKDPWKPYFVGFHPPWRFYQVEEYRSLLQKAQFEPKRLEVVRKEELFSSRAAFHGFIRQWLPHVWPLGENMKDKFLSEVIDIYLQKTPLTTDGQVPFFTDHLEVEAVKR
ncbi:MAG: methyltransferase domain-containing protein [Verrucomicrobia bacterium]|nr:methyltransferase domain-containing protein [Verrucomicrobiota bacterium]